jgi:hypothetical protein
MRDINNLYSSPGIIKTIKGEMSRACSTQGCEREYVQGFGGKETARKT